MTMEAPAIQAATCVIRATHRQKGRSCAVSPDSAAVRHLHYGRIVLEAGDEPLAFATGTHENGLIALGGGAAVEIGGGHYRLGLYDALYVPRDSDLRITPGAHGCDLAEISAPV